MSTLDSEALVIGGGIAGSVLARELARAGREVLLVEKSRGPSHKMCGEFLSHEALGYLASSGLSPAGLGAVPLDRVRLLWGARAIEAALPFPAFSLPRAALDEALLQAALCEGVKVLRGHRVEQLAPAAGNTAPSPSGSAGPSRHTGWTATLANAPAARARAAFLATGKHDLYGLPRPPGSQNDLLAFKMYFRLTPAACRALGSAVELALFPGGYAGLQPVGGRTANLCLVIRKSRYRQLGGQWPALLAHLRSAAAVLSERLDGAEPEWPRPLALASIPYGLLVDSAADGLWRLGDQAVVIPSFAGEGISLAMHSALLAATTYLNGGHASTYTHLLATQLRGQLQRATLLAHALVDAPRLAAATVRLCPPLLRLFARQTRIGSRSLLPIAP